MPNDPAYTPLNSVIDSDQATTILKAATATGAGAAFSNMTKRLGGEYANFVWQVVITGGPTAISTTLQGSDNGTNWQTLDTSTLTTGEARAVANMPVAFLRANLGTLTGGTSPTVTVLIQPG